MHPMIETAVEMTTRDGVTLVADVYRPAADGRWPTLLHRTPYDRTDPTLVSAIVADPLWLARQGFAVVVQDVRGRFASGGDLDFAHQEHDDGHDAVEWAAAQPWSDGAVGVYGSSYHAISAYAAVAARPPHLRAALTMIGAADLAPTVRPGGTFELGFLTLYALGQSLDAVRRLDVDDAERAALTGRIVAALSAPAATVGTLPLTDVDVLSDPRIAPYWADWLRHEPGDAYWDRPTVAADPGRVDVPLLQVASYRDFMAPTMFALAARLAGDTRHRLVAGPWAHGGVYTGHTGARVLPGTPGGVGTWGPLVAAWFDVHLRGGTGAAYPAAARWLAGEPVRYHVGGENRWASAPSWPPSGAGTSWLLGSGGDARSAAGDGHLRPDGDGRPVREDTADTVRADPRDPFPTCGGAFPAGSLGPDGIQDQRAVDHRADVLVYTSEPLAEPVTTAGVPRLVLRFSSTAPDADVCVTLVDVEPDGFAVPVAEGALRTRYRLGGTRDWLVPDEPAEIEVVLHDTAHTFRAGHRIRVHVAGACYPRRSRNLHTTTVPELGGLDEAVVAEHTVHHGPSRLVLPEVASG
ncbi:hypothetical protein EV383_1268 [Pseudonocardia sediminis]|uniref:Xaa-Pro dipeptidyl-peptidase C-terminal domain-containing protein n=2 Tax=Pseudonocardia sediminis TaxID=1397368 RepID=A0A4Q7URG3_PSEST|nr:hypothetical protein EV383_1268 [Pseudonocardia sediminis]